MHTVLSYSFVGAWKSPMTQIPLLDKKFSMDLFNDPYNTIVGLDQSGFIISKQSGKLPHPTVVINSQRLSITCHTLEQLVVVYEKILEEINAVAGGRIPLYFNSFGLNTEHEYADLDQDGPVWLTKHFIENGFNNKEKFLAKLQIYDLRFQTMMIKNMASFYSLGQILIMLYLSQLMTTGYGINSILQTRKLSKIYFRNL
jgi:hypothetical protein